MDRVEISHDMAELDEGVKRARMTCDVDEMRRLVEKYEMIRNHVAAMVNVPLRPLEEFVEAVTKILEPYDKETWAKFDKARKQVGVMFMRRWQFDYNCICDEALITHKELFDIVNVDIGYTVNRDFFTPRLIATIIERVNLWLRVIGKCNARITWWHENITSDTKGNIIEHTSVSEFEADIIYT